VIDTPQMMVRSSTSASISDEVIIPLAATALDVNRHAAPQCGGGCGGMRNQALASDDRVAGESDYRKIEVLAGSRFPCWIPDSLKT